MKIGVKMNVPHQDKALVDSFHAVSGAPISHRERNKVFASLLALIE